MVQAPIFHVNGDDPEAAVWVARLAVEYRPTFGRDVVIDMICYRRRGHNEGDDPSMTNPLMYQIIDGKRSVRRLYTEALIGRGDLIPAATPRKPCGTTTPTRTRLQRGPRTGKGRRAAVAIGRNPQTIPVRDRYRDQSRTCSVGSPTPLSPSRRVRPASAGEDGAATPRGHVARRRDRLGLRANCWPWAPWRWTAGW